MSLAERRSQLASQQAQLSPMRGYADPSTNKNLKAQAKKQALQPHDRPAAHASTGPAVAARKPSRPATAAAVADPAWVSAYATAYPAYLSIGGQAKFGAGTAASYSGLWLYVMDQAGKPVYQQEIKKATGNPQGKFLETGAWCYGWWGSSSYPADQCFWWASNTAGGPLQDGKQYYAWIFMEGTDGSTSPNGTTSPPTTAFYTPGIPGAQVGICTCYAQAHRADPVNTATGTFFERATDATLIGAGTPLSLDRFYRSDSAAVGLLGRGWSMPFDSQLTLAASTASLRTADGSLVVFQKQGNGTYATPAGAHLVLDVSGSTYTVTAEDHSRSVFNSSGQLTALLDTSGHGLTLAYASGRLASITDTAGRSTAFTVGTDGRLSKVALPDGTFVGYTYTAGLLTTVTDPAGKATTYGYDTGQRLNSIIDPMGGKVANTYDTSGRVVTQTDPNGKKSNFSWDNSRTSNTTDANGGVWSDVYSGNVLLQSTDPYGKQVSYDYDRYLRPVAITDRLGNTTSMTYDGAGHMLTRQAPASVGYSESWTYDPAGNMESHTDSRGNTTKYHYVANQLMDSTDPAGGKAAYTYTSLGALESVTTPRGKKTTYGYDPAGNRTSVTTPLGEISTFRYDPAGRITAKTDPRGNVSGADPAAFTTTYVYDPRGPLKSVTDPLGHLTSYDYDDAGMLASVTDAASHLTSYTWDRAGNVRAVTDPAGKITTNTYDPVGNLQTVTDPLGNTTTYTYDKNNHLLSTLTPRGNLPGANKAAFTTSYGYDPNGNRTSVTEPAGALTTTDYDALNRPVSVTDPLKHVTRTSYDGNDNIAATTDPLNKVTAYTYTKTDLQDRRTDPLGKITSYGYDADGHRTTQTTPLGFTTSWSYDADGRTATQVDPRGNVPNADPTKFTTTYRYDEAGNTTKVTDPLGKITTTGYNALNQVETVTDPLGHVTRTGYDELGRIKKVTGPDGAPTSYTYNVTGTLATRTDPNGHPTTYEYDDAGRQKSVTDPLGRKQSIGHDADSNTTTVTNARGTTATTVFDGRGLPSGTTYSDSTAAMATTYYANGQRKTLTDATGTRTFGYDAAGRLKTATPDHGGAFAYSYDDAGQLTNRTYPDGRTYAYGYDADGRQSTMSTPGPVTAATLDPSKLQGIAIAGDSTQTHAVAVADGKVWYAQQKADGTWPVFEDLAPKTGSKPAVSAVAAAWVSGGLQVTMVSGGKLWHSVRKADGTWSPWGDVFGAVGSTLTNLTYSSLTSTASGLEMVAIADGKLWHAIRKPDGTWTPWGNVFGAVGSTLANPSRITVAATPSGLELVAIAGGKLWHTIRKPDATWTAWGDVFGAVHGTLTDPTRVTVASTASGLEVLTVASGKLWHAVRKTDGTWTTWGDVFGAAGALTGLTEATATAAGTDLKVLAGATSLVGYTKRATNGTWINPWQTAAPAPAVTTYGYDPAGNLTTTTLPATNGYTEQRGYDQDGRLASIGSTKAGTALSNWALTLDDAGRPTRVDATRAGQPAASQYYTYDPAGRLLTECAAATQAATCPSPATATTYTYDGAGNRKTQTTPTAVTDYTYDAADQLSSAVTGATTRAFTYDADGNQTGSGGDTLAYDANNRLTQATTGGTSYTFTYDAGGNRTIASKAGTLQRTTAWDLNNSLPQIATETNGSGALIADYAYNPLEQIQTQQTAADAFFYHHDALGSVTDLTNSTGVNQYRNSYTAYGEQTQTKLAATAPADPFGYTGQYKESTPTTAGYNLRARNYDPIIGRFTSQDPIQLRTASPYTADYTYANNGPTYATDPSGRSWYDPIMSRVEAFGGGLVEGAKLPFVFVGDLANAVTGRNGGAGAFVDKYLPIRPAYRLYRAAEMLRQQGCDELADQYDAAGDQLTQQVVVAGLGGLKGWQRDAVGENGGITMGKSAHVMPKQYPIRGGDHSPFAKIKTPEGWFDVVVHGDEANGFIRDPGLPGTNISPAELAQEVRAAGWDGEPVRLLACQAACGTGAQELANELGTLVLAPMQDVRITNSGKVVLWDKNERPVEGDWIPFEPK
ncbi:MULTISPECIES: DUF6531 domain-containing protein [Streptomyces]|uniref:DUF6531 domain-containing protein n=1 Tax=Streptomyces TaxID=1883 RepID=UPI0018DF7546|nr:MULTISPECIES: DUF6531 domain-containing protein [Streptomyces]MCZ4102452.1 DUF6531 domain-containing protein [Streptomyces sp. H39-C1]